MNKQAKPAAEGEIRDRLSQTASISNDGGGEAVADITRRFANLLQLHAKRLANDDGYEVIDPRTVTTTFAEIVEKASVSQPQVFTDWLELSNDLVLLWQRTASRILFNAPPEPVIQPSAQDKRFKDKAWEDIPFDYVKQSYLLMARFLQSSVGNIKGLDPHTRHMAEFYARQFANALAPTNFVATNPVVLGATVEKRGENLIDGLRNFLEDLERGDGRLNLKMTDLDAFKFGENIASSPGKVVFQNELMQLIQYTPLTPKVHRRPLLIVPPWINKFYILDLKPKNSFIRFCVENGHTVFTISWVNPGAELAGKNFADYMLGGPLAAIDAIEQATGETEVNTIGYCIGGTLVASTLAYMAARSDRRINAVTFFTTLLDFSDVGDISVFIDDAQLDLADAHMKRLGYLEGHRMGDAFNLMRENDLIWFFVVNNYLLGRSPAAFDLLYWNSDTTRMPATMQSFYLRNMYHRNLLKQAGGITLANVPIDLRKIDIPTYFLSAREDHIAPWRSTYAGAQLVSGATRFVLGASGHIAGVINPPSANKYGYWTHEELPADPKSWLDGATHHHGSWWTDWANWIAGHAGGEVQAREPGARGLKAIEDAPGSYVRQRAA
jgi:polyhydroxyalkanoate synthase subunit PhaC